MTTKAIIIKKENTNEYDQWVTCYTEEFGKLKTVAKSILKPSSIQALHLDIFNLAEFDLINGRGMPIITGAQVIESFGGIKNSLAKTSVAYFFTEAIDKMVFENDKDGELWSFLVSFLEELNKNDHNPNQRMNNISLGLKAGMAAQRGPSHECPESQKDNLSPTVLLREGQIKLLDILGYFPETDICKSCQDKLNDGNFGAFNHILGGVVCKRCFLSGQGGILISREDFKMLNVRNVRDDGNVGDEQLEHSGAVDQMKRSINSNIAKRSNKRSNPSFQRSILDGMFEYVSGAKFSSLELLNMVR